MIRPARTVRGRMAVWLAGIMAAGLVGGCTLPYRSTPNAAHVPVTLVNTVSPRICIDHQWFRLEVTEQGTTRSVMVPAGKRITLMADDALVPSASSNCNPMLSIQPAPGTRLALHSAVAGYACFIEVVREDGSTPTGVAPEPSTGPPQC